MRSVKCDETHQLRDTIAAHFPVKGMDLLARTEPFHRWFSARRDSGTWMGNRTVETRDRLRVRLANLDGTVAEGLNFAAQDYLGLNDHPAVHQAVVDALHEHGPHSAGSDMLLGNSRDSLALRAELGHFLQREHVVLFPTGWGAAFGAIRGLVRRNDHLVLDRLSHNSLQNGARSATENISYFDHNDIDSAEQILRAIRAKDKQNAILLVTESVFSMDADSPNLRRLGELCREYSAAFLVDVAHDLGALGPTGLGRLEEQDALGMPDLIMGAFSKTFCTTGGFLAVRSEAVAQYVRCFGDANTFSNAMTPLQIAAVRATLKIIRQPEGAHLRAKLLQASLRLRQSLTTRGLKIFGEPCALVPVHTGPERLGRTAAALSARRGVLVNSVEYPAVAIGATRLRLQLSPAHADEDLDHCAQVIADSISEAK